MMDKPKRKLAPPRPVRWLWLAVLLGICTVCTFSGAVVFIQDMQPMSDAASRFLEYRRDDNPAAAFDLLSEALQSELGGPENVYVRLPVRPLDWQFNSFQVSNGVWGQVRGTIEWADGQTESITLHLVKQGGAWRISGF
ncbi:MAG: hypothetical protein MUE40_06335 [Anaerolineae bacterium]|jgi:hypothetical protein|nr:hypothetical protein [Anaerolineae bacterium]